MAFSASIAGQGSAPGCERAQPLGDAALGVIEAGEEDAVRLADASPMTSPSRQFEVERRADQRLRHFEQCSASATSSSVGRPQ